MATNMKKTTWLLRRTRWARAVRYGAWVISPHDGLKSELMGWFATEPLNGDWEW